MNGKRRQLNWKKWEGEMEIQMTRWHNVCNMLLFYFTSFATIFRIAERKPSPEKLRADLL